MKRHVSRYLGASPLQSSSQTCYPGVSIRTRGRVVRKADWYWMLPKKSGPCTLKTVYRNSRIIKKGKCGVTTSALLFFVLGPEIPGITQAFRNIHGDRGLRGEQTGFAGNFRYSPAYTHSEGPQRRFHLGSMAQFSGRQVDASEIRVRLAPWSFLSSQVFAPVFAPALSQQEPSYEETLEIGALQEQLMQEVMLCMSAKFPIRVPHTTPTSAAGNPAAPTAEPALSSTPAPAPAPTPASKDGVRAYAVREVFETYYFPIYYYFRRLLRAHQEQQRRQRDRDAPMRPLFIGVSAPQGCGKTTLTDAFRGFFESEGMRAVSMSLDDFYLTGAQQDAVATRLHPGNKLLELRGNAGTHDVDLALRTLAALEELSLARSYPRPRSHPLNRQQHSESSAKGMINELVSRSSNVCEGEEAAAGGVGAGASLKECGVLVPRYDKSLRSGRGDRTPPSEWACITEPVDVVMFEGWMLGFEALDPQDQQHLPERARLSADMQEVNRQLAKYAPLHEKMDAWLLIALDDQQESESSDGLEESEKKTGSSISGLSCVYKWRLQQEHAMRAQGKPSMTDQQVKDFVSRFMPAYETYLPALYASGPQRRRSSSLTHVGNRSDRDDGAVQAPRSEQLAVPVLKVTVDEERNPIRAAML